MSRYHLVKADYVNKEFLEDIANAVGMKPSTMRVADYILFGLCKYTSGKKVMQILDNAIIADPTFEFQPSRNQPLQKDIGQRRFVYTNTYIDGDGDNELVVTVVENGLEIPCLVNIISREI